MRRVSGWRWLLLGLMLPAGFVQAELWRVGLIGDTPYSERDRREFPVMLAAMAETYPDVIVHIGDIKSGQSTCDETRLRDRLALFDASPVPFVLVPGDNEWTDCHRAPAGGYDPLERLALLRRLFWERPDSLGQRTLPLLRQSAAQPEHSRFRLGPVLFATLNMPGPDNHWGLRSVPNAEFLAREPAVRAWVHDSFALARRDGLRGVVLLFQANPGFRHFSQGLGHRPFRAFLEALRDETLHFDGEVVVVHGDSHVHRIDRPLRTEAGDRIENLTRIETHGYPWMGWTRLVIDDQAPVLFRFESHPWPPM